MAIGLIATSRVSISLTIEDAARLRRHAGLSSIADVSALPAQAIVAVVGTGAPEPSRGGRARSSAPSRGPGRQPDLDGHAIGPRNLVRGAEEMAEEAVRRLHATFFP
ncbi:MAG: hypothetical protein U0166_08255 [Acidobacteriota bacterium]